jgi:hypothetical protein
MAYFSSEVGQPPCPDEYKRLQEFKAECDKKGLMGSFDDKESFGEKLKADLSRLQGRYKMTPTAKFNMLRCHFESKAEALMAKEVAVFSFDKIPLNDGTAELWCVAFQPNTDENSLSRWWDWWRPSRSIRIDHRTFDKSDILEAMDRCLTHAFKFYLRVPNKPRSITKYRNALAKADVIITGEGSVDTDKDFWRIWFLHPLGFIHPYFARSYMANHSLVDLSWL